MLSALQQTVTARLYGRFNLADRIRNFKFGSRTVDKLSIVRDARAQTEVCGYQIPKNRIKKEPWVALLSSYSSQEGTTDKSICNMSFKIHFNPSPATGWPIFLFMKPSLETIISYNSIPSLSSCRNGIREGHLKKEVFAEFIGRITLIIPVKEFWITHKKDQGLSGRKGIHNVLSNCA